MSDTADASTPDAPARPSFSHTQIWDSIQALRQDLRASEQSRELVETRLFVRLDEVQAEVSEAKLEIAKLTVQPGSRAISPLERRGIWFAIVAGAVGILSGLALALQTVVHVGAAVFHALLVKP
jgi:hypothetical protein